MIFIYTFCENGENCCNLSGFFRISSLARRTVIFPLMLWLKPIPCSKINFQKALSNLKLTLVIMNSWGSSSLHIIPCWLLWFQCFFSITLACEAWIVGLVLTEIIRATLPSYCVISPNKHYHYVIQPINVENCEIRQCQYKKSTHQKPRLHLSSSVLHMYVFFFILIVFCRGKHFSKKWLRRN